MDRFREYAFRKIHQASGYRGASWNAELTYRLMKTQHAFNVVGSVGEIGVYHGKYFILLYLSRNENEKAFCIDLFDLQSENIDHSGAGNLDIFRSQVEKFAGDFDVHVLRQNSMEVDPGDIIDSVGKVRAISIDGGHYCKVVRSDLELAENTLTDGGVAIVDDYSNHGWPDVAMGVAEYLSTRAEGLVPFASSPNKIYLTTNECWAKIYIDALKQKAAYLFQGMNALNSHSVAVFTTDYKPPGYPLRRSQWPQWVLKTVMPWSLFSICRSLMPPPGFKD